MLHIFFYDGIDGIGGNKILIEYNESALMLDFGINFAKEGEFFNEFLKPRSIFGLKDLFTLEILPPLYGLYRKDLEIPNLWDKFRDHPLCRNLEISGILLSHSHLDHNGYISYVREDIPIYTNLTSAFLSKALQDTSRRDLGLEVCYVNPRRYEKEMLQSEKDEPYKQRKYMIIGEYKEGIDLSFWEKVDRSKKIEKNPLVFLGEETTLGEFKIKSFPVDHSVPGASSYIIDTPSGAIVYTGDFRVHGKKGYLSKNFIKEVSKIHPRVLICEGTHPEVENPTSEEKVMENAFEVIKDEDKLVIADFAPRNIERLLSFLSIAKEVNRRLVLTVKDIYVLSALSNIEEDIPDPWKDEYITLYFKPKGRRDKWEENIYNTFPEHKMIAAENIRLNERDYILCFSYYDFPALLDIYPNGGIYIYSSSEAYDEEMLVDQERIRNWINFFNFKLYGNLGKDRESSGFHASGHVHRKGLEELIEETKPEFLIPVHTLNKGFFKKFEGFCKVIYDREIWIE